MSVFGPKAAGEARFVDVRSLGSCRPACMDRPTAAFDPFLPFIGDGNADAHVRGVGADVGKSKGLIHAQGKICSTNPLLEACSRSP